jgi:hypothetical protein
MLKKFTLAIRIFNSEDKTLLQWPLAIYYHVFAIYLHYVGIGRNYICSISLLMSSWSYADFFWERQNFPVKHQKMIHKKSKTHYF